MHECLPLVDHVKSHKQPQQLANVLTVANNRRFPNASVRDDGRNNSSATHGRCYSKCQILIVIQGGNSGATIKADDPATGRHLRTASDTISMRLTGPRAPACRKRLKKAIDKATNQAKSVMQAKTGRYVDSLEAQPDGLGS
jgi:hypothetical protein